MPDVQRVGLVGWSRRRGSVSWLGSSSVSWFVGANSSSYVHLMSFPGRCGVISAILTVAWCGMWGTPESRCAQSGAGRRRARSQHI